jgi:DNA/RNA endonuclease G (NUC1)
MQSRVANVALSIVVGGLGGALVVGFATLWRSQITVANRQDESDIAQQAESNAALEAITLGLPSPAYRRVSTDFVAEWDTSRRNPRWVAERLTAANVKAKSPTASEGHFREDHLLPALFRTRLDDFSGSGYDRGHLAAAANHKHALHDTYFLTNVSPQVGVGFNRDYWARVEKFVRSLTARHDAVHVVTGPLFLPQPQPVSRQRHEEDPDHETPNVIQAQSWQYTYPALGQPMRFLPVPTHFFKAICVLSKNGTPVSIAAFILPNRVIPSGTPLDAYIVPFSVLESLSGLSFFSHSLSLESKLHADAQYFVQRFNPAPETRSNGETETRVYHLCLTDGCLLPSERWLAKARKQQAGS